VASGKELARLPHENTVYHLAFSPDGKLLATASGNSLNPNDNTARLWDVASGKELARLPHENTVYHLAFSPNGKLLATASGDKTARLWVWQPEDMITATCAGLNRNLTRAEWRQYLGDEPYRKTCTDLPIGTDFLDEGRKLARAGKFDEALEVYAQAQQLDPALKISAKDWNSLCWNGSLAEQAATVMNACQQAVKLDPENREIRDSRGLARALTGDTKGAIEDFSFYVQELKKGEKLESTELQIKQRTQWITALKAGKNPFDAETLNAIRDQ
jgi:tetratricopeptide (TPR) repeat protein